MKFLLICLLVSSANAQKQDATTPKNPTVEPSNPEPLAVPEPAPVEEQTYQEPANQKEPALTEDNKNLDLSVQKAASAANEQNIAQDWAAPGSECKLE